MNLNTRTNQLVFCFVTVAVCFLLTSAVRAATYTVTTTADSGVGSLRQAVLDANANPGADTINFDTTVFNGQPTLGILSGEILISGPLTIDGPPNRVVLSGNLANRLFRIDDGNNTSTGSIMVTFRNLRLLFGKVFGGQRGGAIEVANENLHCTDCEFYGNISQGAGGAINCIGGVPSFLTLTRCTFSLNDATGPGGAISVYGICITNITDCTFWGNRGSAGGVINQNAGGRLYITGSSLYENTAWGSAAGAIFLNGNFVQPAEIRNCTFSDNEAWLDGGAIKLGQSYAPSITVQNCTIVNNAAGTGGGTSGSGGGIANDLGSSADINLNSCIFWGNTSFHPGPAIYTADTVNAVACLIQSTAGVTTFAGDAFTNANIGVDPKISPLTNNGGLTLTHLIQYGSPAIDNGQNPAGLTTDQRGTVFGRVIDGDCNSVAAPDIGALEVHMCCRGDVNEDNVANTSDLLQVIGFWGFNGAPGGILADVNNDGHVNTPDLLEVIGGWGACP